MCIGAPPDVRSVCRVVLTAIVLSMFNAGLASAQARAASGGISELAIPASTRPALSSGQVQAFMPARGEFTFPAPYSTVGVRLTNASDCGGRDCVNYIGYSYWNNINNHVGSDRMLIFVGLDRSRGGAGPSLFSYNKKTGVTENLGPLFSPDSPYSWSTGEGWYFSATRPTTLYVVMSGSTSLQRYDVLTHAMSTVFDVSAQAAVLGSNRKIWQVHSSDDDRVHSATLKDASYADLGCMVYREDTRQVLFYPQKGLNYDECQIDKSGRYLVIKDKLGIDPRSEVDNRIIDLQTGAEQDLLDANGAGGHSDNGYGTLLAADNMNNQPGAVRLWRFNMDMHGGQPTASVAGQGTLVYQTTSWAADVGHISYSNARGNTPVEQQYACSSQASRQSLPHANEIVCFKLDGSLATLVVAPNLSNLDASGGGSDDYSKSPKGNLDVTGEYFVWSANSGTARNDVYIVHIPVSKLGVTPGTSAPPVSPTPTPIPTPAPPAPSSPTPAPAPVTPPTLAPSTGSDVSWMSLVNVTASGNVLQKTGGCSGCPDAIAVSAQTVGSGGAVQFTSSDPGTLRFIGLGGSGLGLTPSDVPFALRLQGGTAEIRENGAYRSDFPYASGDVLAIAVNGTTVTYSQNGTVVYTSATPAASAMNVRVFLFDPNGSIDNVSITPSVQTPSASTNTTQPVTGTSTGTAGNSGNTTAGACGWACRIGGKLKR